MSYRSGLLHEKLAESVCAPRLGAHKTLQHSGCLHVSQLCKSCAKYFNHITFAPWKETLDDKGQHVIVWGSETAGAKFHDVKHGLHDAEQWRRLPLLSGTRSDTGELWAESRPPVGKKVGQG